MNQENKIPDFLTRNLQLWQSIAIIVGALWFLIGYIDKKFEQIEHRFEQVEHRFDRIEQKFDSLAAEVHRVDKDQVRLEAAYCKINKPSS